MKKRKNEPAYHLEGPQFGNPWHKEHTLCGTNAFVARMENRDDGTAGSPGGSDLSRNTSHASGTRLTKKESLRIQKRSYKEEKKKAYQELKSTIQDPTIVILSDWLKVRSTLKNWSRMWCVLKPGVLVLYKTSKNKQWMGTVLLTSSEIIERPSKKDGFCFKIYHPLEQMIWAAKGPKGENMSLLTSSLPSNHLILRAATESDGQCWMDALELARRCSHLLKKSMPSSESNIKLNAKSKSAEQAGEGDDKYSVDNGLDLSLLQQQLNGLRQAKKSTSDENQPDDRSENGSGALVHRYGIDDKEAHHDSAASTHTDNTSFSSYAESSCSDSDKAVEAIKQTDYIPEHASETFGEIGEAAQTEVLAGENKSLVWTLLKQLRPGMDLSKVVLPTFILEPRSFLDKLSDYYYHADLISAAAVKENPFERMKAITKWYLSGFYKKPKGLKKPYNPILGETFRCKWQHPDSDSFTYYIAEQVSHHPPVSAFAVVNRKDGFVINGSILAKSKFYGNSLSAILDGTAVLTFLKRGEDYTITMPYAHCKGILYGTMTLEFGGKVQIACKKTGYSTELEFKLKPFFGGSDAVNRVTGRILLGKKVLATLSGYWDQEVFITEMNDGVATSFWKPSNEVKAKRLHRHLVTLDQQLQFESQNLWQHVTKAIDACDQEEATKQKYILEENQRKAAHERHRTKSVWVPKLFEYDAGVEQWAYKYLDKRPWDSLNDIVQYENDGCIATRTKHKTRKFLPRSESSLTAENVKNHDKMWSRAGDILQSTDEGIILQEELETAVSMEKDIKETLTCIRDEQEHILRELAELRQVVQRQDGSNSSLLMLGNVFLILLVAVFAMVAYFQKFNASA